MSRSDIPFFLLWPPKSIPKYQVILRNKAGSGLGGGVEGGVDRNRSFFCASSPSLLHPHATSPAVPEGAHYFMRVVWGRLMVDGES